jgi:hypothetical protein
MHKSRYFTFSGSCKQVYDQSRDGTLECGEMDYLIFERYYLKELCFGGPNYALKIYVESNLVGDIDSRMRTIVYVFTVGGT